MARNRKKQILVSTCLREEEFYSVYTKCTILEPAYVKATVKFLDDFYKTINDKKAANIAFTFPCNPEGRATSLSRGWRRNKATFI